MANEKVKISLPIVPTLDKRAAKNVTAEIQAMERQLGPIKVSFDQLAKTASSSVKELNRVSSAAADMGKNITKTVKKASGELGSLAKGMKGVKGGSGGGSKGGGGEDVSDAQEDLVDTTEELSDAMSDLLKSTKSQVDVSKRAMKAQADFAKSMKARSKEKFEGFGDMMKDLPNLFKKGSMAGGAKGVAGGMGKMFGVGPGGMTSAKAAVSGGGGGGAAGGAAAAGGGAAGGGMASAAGALMKAGPYIAAAAAAIMAIAKILSMASDNQVKLNKALMEGIGNANDFGVSVQGYRDGLDEMRDAVQNVSGVMLKLGGNSETTAKVVNAFTKEATGSLMQTRRQFYELGKAAGEGTAALDSGVQEMTTAAIGFGKALGMSAEEAATMMGKFTSELGYSAQGSIDAMSNIVKAAATANMPMTKFMGIFHSVIPDMETYQNRLEELTGTIKLLSKTMSASDVKKFTSTFAKGFKGTDMKQRIRTVAEVGMPQTSNILKTDNEQKARQQAKSFEQFAEAGENMSEKFMKAMQDGPDAMNSFITEMQARASRKGTQLTGDQVGRAQDLTRMEGARKKGGMLDLATALKGAGMNATFKLIRAQSQAHIKGFDGLSEAVQNTQGISEEQREGTLKMINSLKAQKDMLKKYGMTNSKSMNKGLREQVMLRKNIKDMAPGEAQEKAIADAMADASEDEIMAASETSNAELETTKKAVDLAEMTYDVQTSISDKISNIIEYLLEQILRVLNPVLDVLNSMLSYIISGSDKEAKRILDLTSNMKGLFPQIKGMSDEFNQQNKAASIMIDQVGGAISKNLAAGKTGDDLADAIAGSGMLGGLNKLTSLEEMRGTFEKKGMKKEDIDDLMNKWYSAKDDAAKLKALDAVPGKLQDSIMDLTQFMASHSSLTSDKAKAAAGLSVTKRPDQVKSKTAAQTKAEAAGIQAGQGSDIQVLGAPKPGAEGPGVYNPAELTEADAKKFMAGPSGASGSAPAAAGGGAPTGGGAPATAARAPTGGGAPAAVAKDTHSAIQDTAKIAADQSKTVDDQLKTQVDDYAATSDMLSLLKKGIRYEQSWMGTKYKNVLKEATLESFRTALMEFAVLQIKLEKDSKLKDALATGQGWNFAAGGKNSLDKVLGSDTGKSLEALQNMDSATYGTAPGHAAGGSIDYDQMARLHKGEMVVPKGGMLVKGGDGGGGKTVNVTATINVQTDADPKQIAAAVHDLYRAH